MSSLEALTGTGVYAKELGGVSAAPSSFVEATVATTPTAVDEEVMVLVGAEGSQLQAGPCRWTPRPGAQPWPRRGDPCLVVTGDKGHRALEWWKPAVPAALGIPRVTALPNPAVDGQEVAYVADAAKGVLWHLKYNAESASTYKWEYEGGSRLIATVTTEEAISGAQTSYGDLSTTGPSLTPPLSGDYEITVQARIGNVSAAADLYMSFQPGAGSASDNDAIKFTNASAYPAVHNSRDFVKALTASATQVAKYKTSGATANFSYRTLAIRPIRVG